MPKRRKRNKSADARRQPLRFQESPVNKVKKYPSPVFASDHPPTARVIPVDPDLSCTWVSPQFQNGSCQSSTMPRRKRQTRSSGPQNASHVNGNNASSLSCTLRTRQRRPPNLGTLRFMGDKSIAPPSPVEEINFSTEDESGDEKQKYTENINSVLSPAQNITRQATPLSASNITACLTRVTPGEQDRTGENGTPLHTVKPWKGKSTARILRAKNMRYRNKRINFDSQEDSLDDLERININKRDENERSSSPHFPMVRRVTHLRLNDSSNQVQSPDYPTQVKPKSIVNLEEHTRLLIKNICDNNTDSDTDLALHENEANYSKVLSEVGNLCQDMNNVVHTPPRFTFHYGSENSTPNLQEMEQYGSIYTPERRLSSRINKVFSALLTPIRHTGTPKMCPHEILVCDTPEEDYGLPVRLRRKKINLSRRTALHNLQA